MITVDVTTLIEGVAATPTTRTLCALNVKELKGEERGDFDAEE